MTSPIRNVSDTARWVAIYRAMETERPDAIFRDQWARKLAGPEGEAIVNAIPRGRSMAWAMIVRTAMFDELIMNAIRNEGVDLVLNLAAGLDARPWRLPVAPTLKWIDVDLPGILQYKLDTIGDTKPLCDYEAAFADLTDAAARDTLFTRVASMGKNIFVITEGLLIYLTPGQVSELATALAARPSFHWWVTDLMHPKLKKMVERSWSKALKSAPFQFAPAEGSGFFKPFGWNEAEWRSSFFESFRLNRTMQMAWLWKFMAQFQSKAKREEGRRFAGALLMKRA